MLFSEYDVVCLIGNFYGVFCFIGIGYGTVGLIGFVSEEGSKPPVENLEFDARRR